VKTRNMGCCLIPTKIAESDIRSLGHGLCASSGSIYNKDTTHKIISFILLALTIIDPAINTGWFEIVEAINKSATSIQDLFHNTRFWLARYPRPQFIVFDNGNEGKFKREFKQMCMQDNCGIKANPTTIHNHSVHKQMQSLSEYTELHTVNDMLRSFD
jgi:hypothetical protein